MVPLTPATLAPELDLILDLSTRSVDPRHIAVPRLGYWTLVYGEEPERSEPALHEFLAGRRAAFVRLVRLTRPNGASVLKEGVVKAVTHSLSATRERLLQISVDWPAQQLQACLAHPGAVEKPEVRLRERGPLALLCLRALIPFAWLRNVLRRIAQEATREHWAVGVISQPIHLVLESYDPASICWLPAPSNGFLADPFGIVLPNGTLRIMAEALSWDDELGRIVTFERRPDGSLTPLQDVLALTSHASYPQLIEHEGEIFCIPETSQQRRVQLFKAESFPDRWIPDRVLLDDFAGADATVCRHGERWWMFVGNHEDQDETKLFIFHSADLRGPWTPHAANPVKCDLRSARPAGTPFTMAGHLYRPAQDCSATYGGAVVINKVTTLTPAEFAEEPVKRLLPSASGPYPDGLHTLTAAGDITLVDGKWHELSLASVTMTIRRLARGLRRR